MCCWQSSVRRHAVFTRTASVTSEHSLVDVEKGARSDALPTTGTVAATGAAVTTGAVATTGAAATTGVVLREATNASTALRRSSFAGCVERNEKTLGVDPPADSLENRRNMP